MLTTDLVNDIERIIQEPTYTKEDIVRFINQGVLDIAGGGAREHGHALVAPLAGLYSSGDVTLTAGDYSTDMPSTYQRGLKLVLDSSGYKLKEYLSHPEFMTRYNGETGDPEAFCLVGNTLWLGPSPSSDATITLYFYRLPVDMTDENGTIDGIPAHYQKRLLTNFVCKEIYSEIEQGLDGAMPDTAKHTVMYQAALTDLERHIGPEDFGPINIGDDDYGEEYIS